MTEPVTEPVTEPSTVPVTDAPIRLGLSPLWPRLFLAGTPLLAGALGWGLAWLARAAAALPWVPFQGPLELVALVPVAWVAAGLALLGLGAGAWLAHEAERGDLVLLLGPEAIEARQGGWSQAFGRDEVAGVLRDGAEVVLLGHDGSELLRGPSEASLLATAAACEAMGYPWLGEGDPFAAAWRPWVDGHPDLDARAHALLRLRQAAVAAGDRVRARAHARDLRREGLVVRDGRDGQAVRRGVHSSPTSATLGTACPS